MYAIVSLLAVQVLGLRVYWCSVTLPQGKNSAGRITNCCYVIVGLARRLSFLQIHVLCGEHPYTGLMVISTNFLCKKKNRPFNVRLENPHVIDANQIWVGVVSTGPSGRPLNSSYRTRDSIEYKLELGNTIGMCVTKETHSESCDEEFFPHLNMKSN